MSYILHLETATKVCSVALSKDGVLIALKETLEDGYSHGENLTLFIQSVLEDGKIKIEDLSAVSVASGPGSYTGLRIGVATAKGICYAQEIPLIAIDALTALTEQAKELHPGANLCAMIDARRMEVYNLVTSSGGEKLKEISADIIDELSYSTFEPFVYFGDGAAKLSDIWENKNCKADLTIRSSAKGQVKLSYKMLQANEIVDTAYFEPFYLKDFIAGKKKKS